MEYTAVDDDNKIMLDILLDGVLVRSGDDVGLSHGQSGGNCSTTAQSQRSSYTQQLLPLLLTAPYDRIDYRAQSKRQDRADQGCHLRYR